MNWRILILVYLSGFGALFANRLLQTGLAHGADTATRRARVRRVLLEPSVPIGMLFYCLAAACWFFAVFLAASRYNTSEIVLVTCCGALIGAPALFGNRLGKEHIFGLVCALIAALLMTQN